MRKSLVANLALICVVCGWFVIAIFALSAMGDYRPGTPHEVIATD